MLWGFALLVIVVLWSPSATTFLMVLTLMSAGLAVALRDVLLSFFGWIHLLLAPALPPRGPNRDERGSRGRGGHPPVADDPSGGGRVVGAHQSTGRLLHIPNAWIYVHGVKNYTEGFHYLRLEQSVVVTFDSNWNVARELLRKIADEQLPNVEQAARSQLQKMTSEYLV